MWDELDEPLGFAAGSASALAARDKRPMRGAATVAAILAFAIGLAMLPRPDFPVKGEPFAVAKVEISPAPPKLVVVPDATASVVQTPPAPAASTAQVETTNGVKITRGAGEAPKPLIIDVAQALGARLPPDSRPPDQPKYGLSPRIAVDGTRSAQPDH
ncbi:MAG: hypothetical protein WCF81_06775 [Roseiarcus sp.]